MQYSRLAKTSISQNLFISRSVFFPERCHSLPYCKFEFFLTELPSCHCFGALFRTRSRHQRKFRWKTSISSMFSCPHISQPCTEMGFVITSKSCILVSNSISSLLLRTSILSAFLDVFPSVFPSAFLDVSTLFFITAWNALLYLNMTPMYKIVSTRSIEFYWCK